MINAFNFEDGKIIDLPLGLSVFCDLDGTLVDTDYANYLAYRRAIKEATHGMYDVNFSNERLNRESLKKRFISLTDEQLELITSLKSKYFSGFISKTRLNIALADLFTSCHRKNTIILVTCCRKMRVMEILNYYNLFECFSQIICQEDLLLSGLSNKYEHAIALAGTSPETILVFENDDIFIEQAIISGVPSGNIYKVFL
jgi:beta-phosphoglucomutase-like phosphatase (HAD superfamily)